MSILGSIQMDNVPIPLGAVTVFPTAIMSFDVGDGQPNSPNDGDTSLEVPSLPGIDGSQQSIANVDLLVLREGIGLKYSTALTPKDIRRYNHAGKGGWVFEPAGGQFFIGGQHYDVFIVGYNNTDQV